MPAVVVPSGAMRKAFAELMGIDVLNGLGLLLNQARLAFKAWFGVLPDVTPELVKAVHATF